MENLNDNQKLVMKFLTNNAKESFNMTQVGVQAGKKIPKSASTWSKPILESLVKLKLILKIEKEGKTLFQIITKKIEEKIESKKVEVKEEKKIIIETKTQNSKSKKEVKEKIEKLPKEVKIKTNLLTSLDKEEFNSKLENEASKLNISDSKNSKIRALTTFCKITLVEMGIREKSLNANLIKGFIFKSVKNALGENYETRTDGREFEKGEIVKFKGGNTLDKEGKGEILDIKFNTHGHRYMRLRIDGGLIIDKTDKFLIKI